MDPRPHHDLPHTCNLELAASTPTISTPTITHQIRATIHQPVNGLDDLCVFVRLFFFGLGHAPWLISLSLVSSSSSLFYIHSLFISIYWRRFWVRKPSVLSRTMLLSQCSLLFSDILILYPPFSFFFLPIIFINMTRTTISRSTYDTL